MWAHLGQEAGTALGEVALEACRTADRLDELDRIIAGKGVLQLMKFRLDHIDWDDEGAQIKVTVGFQSVLAEARMQQGALKDLLKEIRLAEKVGAGASSPAGAPVAPPPATGLDELTARRLEREQASV